MRRRLSALAPSHTVPHTSWRSDSRWRTGPGTFGLLVLGLWLFGTGEALLVSAGLGNGPWTVLAQGLTTKLPISIGMATFAISITVLLLWIPLRERPGLGTIMNAIVIATALQVMLFLLPSPTGDGIGMLLVRLAMVLGGIALIGLGSGIYLTTGLGPGPRDGWMTGIHQRTGWPVSRVRLAIEAVVLVLGWLLGGTVGIGTVLFALLVGPAVGYGLRVMGAVSGRSSAPDALTRAEERDGHPELEA